MTIAEKLLGGIKGNFAKFQEMDPMQLMALGQIMAANSQGNTAGAVGMLPLLMGMRKKNTNPISGTTGQSVQDPQMQAGLLNPTMMEQQIQGSRPELIQRLLGGLGASGGY